MHRSGLLAILLMAMFSVTEVDGQEFSKIKWLEGTWEGTGYVISSARPQSLKFEFKFDSLSIWLGSVRKDRKIQEAELDLFADSLLISRTVISKGLREIEPEYIHIDVTGGQVEIYFLGEMKYENRRLLITKVNPDCLTLSLAYNRGFQEMLAMGSFKRKKKIGK